MPLFHPAGRGGWRWGSVAGYGGLPKATVYGRARRQLINFAETLYLDLAPAGVSVFLRTGLRGHPLTAQNDFTMPAPDDARGRRRGHAGRFCPGDFGDPLPRRFTMVLKLLRFLPRRLYFALIHRLTGL